LRPSLRSTSPSGLQQLGARFYWPELGRFIQQDPGRDGINWYAYGANNPLRNIDPEGLEEEQPCPDDKCKECTEEYRAELKDCADTATGHAWTDAAVGTGIWGALRARACGIVGAIYAIASIGWHLDDYADCLQDAIDTYKLCWSDNECEGTPPGLADQQEGGGS
jgi:hypothetical protein